MKLTEALIIKELNAFPEFRRYSSEISVHDLNLMKPSLLQMDKCNNPLDESRNSSVFQIRILQERFALIFFKFGILYGPFFLIFNNVYIEKYFVLKRRHCQINERSISHYGSMYTYLKKETKFIYKNSFLIRLYLPV